MKTAEKVSHTSGPWLVKKGPGISEFYEITHPSLRYKDDLGYMEPYVIANTCNQVKDEDQDLANARLIAAAPELLEACEMIGDELVNGQNVPSLAAMDKLAAAIKKAKGEQLCASYPQINTQEL